MRLSYQRKLTLSFLVIFISFTVGILLFEKSRTRQSNTVALEQRLDAYAEVVHKYLQANPIQEGGLQDLIKLLPSNLRLTVIGENGKVIFDNLFPEPSGLDNHAERPEVIEAKERGEGYDIRTSASNNMPYLYYAKYFGNNFVRVALPYDFEVINFLKSDNGFLYFIFALFLIGILFINYVGGYFGKSIRRLRDFASAVSAEGAVAEIPYFPKDELGEIGDKIARGYKTLKSNEVILTREREKLLQHVQSSAEGVCFFNPDGTVAFYNGLFLQYVNTVSDTVVSNNPAILSLDVFQPIRNFIESKPEEKYFEARVQNQGREFLLRVNVFEDDSFEIVFNDITRQERTRRLKQEMTGNIAHELRTPVTSIRGYLETVLETPLPPEKQQNFIKKAYDKTLALSELIRDMGLLTKIEETPNSFAFGKVSVTDVVGRVISELQPALTAKKIVVESKIPVGLTVSGNEILIYSVFRNLTDNAINHAGEGVTLSISKFGERDGYIYISFADNGRGIADETHLNRLFERFYRVDEGRTRDTGGSGLGLSIVKNIINLHGGTISVKSRREGGLEFLFSLPMNARG